MTSVPFVDRHIGPSEAEITVMLEAIGQTDLDTLTKAAVPEAIRDELLTLPAPVGEDGVLDELRRLGARNEVLTSMIGLGYSASVVPPVIQRNLLENPAWYTAYTPYQPEISQGRLEALLNFQTVITDLTGLALAGASLLDESTAAAEAMQLIRRAVPGEGGIFLVDVETLPQTISVLKTRAEPLGIGIEVADLSGGLPTRYENAPPVFGLLLQYPGASGVVRDLAPVIAAAHDAGAQVAVAADLLALTILTSPGELGADVAVGHAQRFGLPLSYGGPHAGYIAVRTGLERSLPGRLVGVSVDADGAPAYRLALQTREQHIRREKATSNICTAQVLPAVLASMYAVWHGPRGLTAIAERIHQRAAVLAAGLTGAGFSVRHSQFFDTVAVAAPAKAGQIVTTARSAGINLRLIDSDTVGISVDETTTVAHLRTVWSAFGMSEAGTLDVEVLESQHTDVLPSTIRRTSGFLTHPVFSSHHSETSLLRYLRRLSDKDIALDRSMIPLGSCTMKLNATAEMASITWPEFADLHPFAPVAQTSGTRQVIADLENWLAELTGYSAVSLQPNAGSQGELAGLLAIRGYHRGRGDVHRDTCLIPSSAHGTNAASAVMAGMKVVVVACDEGGNVDLDDLRAKIAAHRERLSALMITYPSTHGVYEETVRDVCALVHEAGGQVYVDGANLNALVGLAKPGKFGADVSHLNLHKTFCIPHGGGGPGVGPVAVREHLAPYLPGHPLVPEAGPVGSGAVSGAPWGSAGILTIPWAYIRMMGGDGLRRATQVAVLSANYLARKLSEHYPVLYAGRDGLVAHECILDLRPLTKATGVTVDDVAKRLIDYGFHAPTMSFPVAGTLMVEPTESEDLAELDRFVDAMIAIRAEADQVGQGVWPVTDNPLRNSPHTATMVTADVWEHPYPREIAAYPRKWLRDSKYWSPVRRIDGAYGDRNLICSCPPTDAYED